MNNSSLTTRGNDVMQPTEGDTNQNQETRKETGRRYPVDTEGPEETTPMVEVNN